MQGYFCKGGGGGGGSLVLPKSEYEQTETPSAHGIGLKRRRSFNREKETFQKARRKKIKFVSNDIIIF